MVRPDFAADFDHLTAEGNRKLADWALAGDLSWLLQGDGAVGRVP
jgi:hypothetical protein